MEAQRLEAQQQTLFGDRYAEAKNRRWAEIAARKAAIKREARQARDDAYRAWFRSRAREFNGVNDRNRAQITAESIEYGRRAAEHVYLRHGYTVCGADVVEVMHDENTREITGKCPALVSPGFTACPDHTPISD